MNDPMLPLPGLSFVSGKRVVVKFDGGALSSAGVAPTATLRRRVEGLEASTKARFEAAPGQGKFRRFKEFFDGAQSWSRVERIIARVEVGAEGPDTRFVGANLKKRNARALYEDL